MNYIVLACLFALSGFFMKFSDDAYDISGKKQYSSILGIFCAVASAVATIISTEAACIFIGILIGNLLAFKVDGIHHIVTLVVFAILVLIFGIGQINLVILLICIFAALLDEVGHELIAIKIDNKFIIMFFKYRFTMKVIILILAVIGLFNIWIFICFLLFEIFYEIAGYYYNKIIF